MAGSPTFHTTNFNFDVRQTQRRREYVWQKITKHCVYLTNGKINMTAPWTSNFILILINFCFTGVSKVFIYKYYYIISCNNTQNLLLYGTIWLMNHPFLIVFCVCVWHMCWSSYLNNATYFSIQRLFQYLSYSIW